MARSVGVTRDNGRHWSYPQHIYTNLPQGYLNGSLFGASCNGKLCIATGNFQNEQGSRPLLALSRNGGTIWSYPNEIQTKLPANFIRGNFAGATCSGTICIASRSYDIEGGQSRPLLAVTKDSGQHWTYPTSIQNLPACTTSATLYSPSCSGNLCIAAGEFETEEFRRPLLAISHTGGSTWSYPSTIYQNVPQQSNSAVFESASCSGTLCIATGFFDALDGKRKPLLAVTRDGGSHWSYPSVIYNNLPADFNDKGVLSYGANCKGSICTAIGQYNDGNVNRPLLAISSDGGVSWSYPSEIHSNSTLPANFIEGVFSPDL